jgi:hypothetical protein
MAGRWRERHAAERLRKPASGTVVGGMGPADRFPAKTGEPDPGNRKGRELSPPRALKGMWNPKRGAFGREAEGGNFGIDREGGSNPMRG